MNTENNTKMSKFEEILEKGIDIIKRPFVIKKVKRAFSSAIDNLEEDIEIGFEDQISKCRKELADVAKEGGKLEPILTEMVAIYAKKRATEQAKVDLITERDILLK